MKYSGMIGMAAAVLIVIACFLPWAYYPDLGMPFTGFFSKGNAYGRPGKLLVPLASLAFGLFLIPRIWSKRFNLIVVAVILAYSIKTFVLFSSCYSGVCPEKRAGLYLMLFSSLLIFIMALIPDMRLRENKVD
jgi:hypothetical protein